MVENELKKEETPSIPDDRFMFLLAKGVEGCPVRYEAAHTFSCGIQRDGGGSYEVCNVLECPCMHWAKVIATEVIENMMVKIIQQLTKGK